MPIFIPNQIHLPGEANSEKKVFELFRRIDDDELLCIFNYQWSWYGDHPSNGEADFILVHPKQPLIVGEIKGGLITYGQGQWLSRDRFEKDHVIKDPYFQARRSLSHLIRFLCKTYSNPKQWIANGHMVVFPDTPQIAHTSANLSEKVSVFQADIIDEIRFSKRIKSIFSYWSENQGRGQGHAHANQYAKKAIGYDLYNFIKSYYTKIPAYQIGYTLRMQEDNKQIEAISQRQRTIIDSLAGNRIVSIKGSAGSGKTILAMEKVRQCASDQKKVLFLCYNELLAERLKKSFKGESLVTVTNFHKFCQTMLKSLKVALTHNITQAGDYWKEVIAKASERCDEWISIAQPEYGAIVVDEAQDFEEDWWLIINSILEFNPTAEHYLFYDANQDIRGGYEDALETPCKFELLYNFRNCGHIHDFIKRSTKLIKSETLCPQGEKPLLIKTDPNELQSTLKSQIHDLIHEKKYSPQDIVVLTGLSLKKSKFEHGMKIGNFVLSENDSDHNAIRFETVRRFKGLESPIVIVCELEKQNWQTEKAHGQLVYVALSRAVHRLIILGEESFLNTLEQPPSDRQISA